MQALAQLEAFMVVIQLSHTRLDGKTFVFFLYRTENAKGATKAVHNTMPF